MATRPRDLVRDGTVMGYVLSAYSARKLKMEPTGNGGGVHNVVVAHGERDLPGLLREMGTGLLVTDLIGFGINQVTGDYSRGASGFWIENGTIQYPVEEITIAGNLKEMYRGIVAIGNDVDRRGNFHAGSVLIDRMTIAGE
jgi:PmbA protein